MVSGVVQLLQSLIPLFCYLVGMAVSTVRQYVLIFSPPYYHTIPPLHYPLFSPCDVLVSLSQLLDFSTRNTLHQYTKAPWATCNASVNSRFCHQER